MKQKILIVDDKPENLLALEKVLGGLAAGIVKALSGEEALKASLHEEFSLAILDVQMPGMDGYELASFLRNDARTSLLPIIFLSAVYSDQLHVDMGYQAGAVDFLTKPFRPELLLAKARFFLEFDRQRVELATSKRHLETLVEAQRRSNEQLRQEVERRRAAQKKTREAMRAAQKADKAKGVFLANMSHELRTPMNGVMGMLQLLSAGGLSLEQHELVDIAKSSAMSLLRILSDILDLSSIEAGKMTLREEEFDPGEVVLDVVQALRAEARGKKLVLEPRLEDLLPGPLVGDAGRIRQVLVNLAGNAIKYTTRGGVVLEAGRLSRPGGRTTLLFTVTDTGIGIPEHQLDSIFEPFTQADGSYSRSQGGVGLGLSIVRSLVEGMGGAILASSKPGRGTVMEVAVPVGVAPASCPLPGLAELCKDKSKPLGYNVLVAEDDIINRMCILRFLEALGCTANAVEDGDQVLEALSAGRYDLVLMDVSMRRMDGTEATRAIRGAKREVPDPDIPIVAMTAHAMKGDRERFLAEGMDDYVTKPLLLPQMRSTLERVMRARCGQAPS